VALAAACSSGGDGGNTTAPTGPSPASPGGATGDTSVAWELFTQADEEELFGTPVERVDDAVEQGLITASAIPPGSRVCYRPTPNDGSRFAAVAVLPPGALTEEEYQAQVVGGFALGGRERTASR